MCLESPITTAVCVTGRAGVRRAYFAQCEAVSDIAFSGTTREVTGFTMDVLHPVPVFLQVDFEKNTAFFNQAKTRVKNNINYAQTLSMIFGINNATLNALLTDLNRCCCYIVVVELNTGQRRLMGVSYDDITDTWTTEDLKTGEGSDNSGADPVADSNEVLDTVTANTSYSFAPFLATSVVIPV